LGELLGPHHTQALSHRVLKKLGGRHENLYMVVETQHKPIRLWCGFYKRRGRGRTEHVQKKP